MFADLSFSFLLAQATAAAGTAQAAGGLSPLQKNLLLVVLVILGSVGLGHFIATRLRMPDFATKISFILFCFAAGIVTCIFGQYKLGIDLNGGNVLIYQVQSADMPGVVKQVADARHRPCGAQPRER